MKNNEAYLKFGESNDLRTTSPKEFDVIYALGLRDGEIKGLESAANRIANYPIVDDGIQWQETQRNLMIQVLRKQAAKLREAQ